MEDSQVILQFREKYDVEPALWISETRKYIKVNSFTYSFIKKGMDSSFIKKPYKKSLILPFVYKKKKVRIRV